VTYCWRCPACGLTLETATREAPICSEPIFEEWAGDTAGPLASPCGATMTRDYRAEAVEVGSGVRESRMSKGRQDTRAYSRWAEQEAG